MANKYEKYLSAIETGMPPKPAQEEGFVSGRGLESLRKFGEGADASLDAIGEGFGYAADLPVIKQILQGLGAVAKAEVVKPLIRGVGAVSTTPPTVALAGLRALKGEQSFGEGIKEGIDRYKAEQQVGYGDVMREATEFVPEGTPGKRFINSTAGLVGDVMLDPMNSIRLFGLTQKGVLAKKFAESSKTAEQIVEASKAAGATDDFKKIAAVIQNEGVDALTMPGSRAGQIKAGFREIVTPSNPLKPFAMDAPLNYETPEFGKKLSYTLAYRGGQGIGALQRTEPMLALQRAFTNYPHMVSGASKGIKDKMDDVFRKARIELDISKQGVRDMQTYLSEKRVPVNGPMKRILYGLGIMRHETESPESMARMMAAVEAPFRVTDPTLHEAKILNAFGTTDPEELALMKYDAGKAASYDKAIKDIDEGIAHADRGILTAESPEALAEYQEMRKSLVHWRRSLDINDTAAPTITKGGPTLAQLERQLAGIDKQEAMLQERMQTNVGASETLQAEFQKAANPYQRDALVKRSNALAQESESAASEGLQIERRRKELEAAIKQRQIDDEMAASEIEFLSSHEHASLKAGDLLGDADADARKLLEKHRDRKLMEENPFKERTVPFERQGHAHREDAGGPAVDKVAGYRSSGAVNIDYPVAGDTVGGLRVSSGVVPNTDSIGASLSDYDELPGIREMPMSDFNTAPPNPYSVQERDRIHSLADQLKSSGEIKPLIVVIDKDGPYILEGGHRFDALKLNGVKSFPALVVTDNESLRSASSIHGSWEGGLRGNAARRKRAATLAKKKADFIKNETIAERAHRLSKTRDGDFDPVVEARLLSEYLDEAEFKIAKKDAGGKLVEGDPLPDGSRFYSEPPAPNVIFKPVVPERADKSSVVTPGVKPKAAPEPTAADIEKSVEQNQSVLDVLRRGATDPETGIVDGGKAKRQMETIFATPGATDNIARELSRDVIRLVGAKEREGVTLIQKYFKDMFTNQNTLGVMIGYLDDYIAHIPTDGKKKALDTVIGNIRKGTVPVARHTKKRTMAETIFDLNDALRHAGSDKGLSDDIIEIMGVYGRDSVKMTAAKKAMDQAIAMSGGIELDAAKAKAVARSGYKSAMMAAHGGFSKEAIAEAAKYDKRLIWREDAGGRVKVGKQLKAIADEVEIPQDLTPRMKWVLSERAKGVALEDIGDVPQAVAMGQRDPLKGMDADDIRAAASTVTADLRLAEQLKDLYLPEGGIFLSRYGLDKVGGQTDLGERSLTTLAGIQNNLAEAQKSGRYAYEVGPEVYPDIADLVEKGHVRAFLMPKQVAEEMNGHIHRFNDASFGEIPSVVNTIRKWYSKTTLLPYASYHMGNMVGDVYNAVVFGGAKLSNFARGMGILEGKNAAKVYTNHLGESLTGKELLEMAKKDGAFSSGFYSVENFEQMVDDIAHAKDPVNRGLDVLRRAGELGENWRRFSFWLDGWEMGMDGAHATARVNKYMHNYNDMTKFERGLRSFAPFYSFARKNVPMVLQQWAQRPYLTQLDDKIQRGLQGEVDQEVDASLNERMRNRRLVKLYEDEDGKDVMFPIDWLLPSSGAQQFTASGKSAAEFTTRMAAPYFRIPYELVTNKSVDTGRPIYEEGRSKNLFGHDFRSEAGVKFAHAASSFRALRTIDDILFGGQDQYADEAAKKSALQRAAASLGLTIYNYPTDEELDRRQVEIDNRADARVREDDRMSDREIDRAMEKSDKEQEDFDRKLQGYDEDGRSHDVPVSPSGVKPNRYEKYLNIQK